MPFTRLRGRDGSDGTILEWSVRRKDFFWYGLQIDMWLSLANDHPGTPIIIWI